MSRVWTLLRMNPISQNRYIGYVAEKWPEVELYAPMYTAMRRPHGIRKPHGVRLPCYPGYVFARPDIVAGDHINLTRTPIRTWFVRFGRWIEVVPDIVIEEVKRLEKCGELIKEERCEGVRQGQLVVVKSGYVNVSGLVIKLCGGRAEVDVGSCRVNVVLGQLEVMQ